MQNFSNKIALVTGASRGLGYQLALQLGAAGAQVIALGRTVGGLEQLDDAITHAGGKPATLVPLDLGAGHDQIDQLGAMLFERYGRLDLFMHAAATLGTLGPLTHQDPVVFQRVMQINCAAPFRLLRSLTPLLQKGTNAAAVLVDCALGDDTIAYWGPYRASKAAMRTLANSYAREVQGAGIRVHMPVPAPMGTKLHITAFPGVPESELASPEQEAKRILADIAA